MSINSNIEWVPFVSQTKMFVEFLGRDRAAASNTRRQFFRRCPVVSQVAAGIGLGNTIEDANKETFIILGQIANSCPLVGHLKGFFHLANKDSEASLAAFMSSTRSTAVMAAGYLGRQWSVSAAATAGVFTGFAFDALGTAIVKKPVGVILSIKLAANYPSPGSVFDVFAAHLADGCAASFVPGNVDVRFVMRCAPFAVISSMSTPLIEEAAPQYFDETESDRSLIMNRFMDHSQSSASPCRDISDYGSDIYGSEGGKYRAVDQDANTLDVMADLEDALSVLDLVSSPIVMVDPISNKEIRPFVSMVELPPKFFGFTSVIKLKSVYRGALNIVLRHAHQLDKIVPHFTIQDLPQSAVKTVRYLQNAPDRIATEYLATLEKLIAKDKRFYVKTIKMQLTLLEFLTEHMTEEDYLGEIVDNRGRSRSVWRIVSKLEEEHAIVTHFGCHLHKPDQYISKPFREIVRFQFISIQEARRTASMPRRRLT